MPMSDFSIAKLLGLFDDVKNNFPVQMMLFLRYGLI